MKEYTFSGHDTFSLRHGWLKKIYDRAVQFNVGIEGDPEQTGDFEESREELFNPETAMSEFGVGKNMVRSMRYWASASNLFSTSDKKFLISPLGNLLMAEKNGGARQGLDPFFEHPASLWLLHWEIATNARHCTAWDIAFSTFARTVFKKEDLFEASRGSLQTTIGKFQMVLSRKDVNCIMDVLR